MKKSVRAYIMAECYKYAGVYELHPLKRKILEKLAIKSWENMPAKQKHKWNLGEIIRQGL